jgi:dTDP-4-dehydrorhamnose reductase
MKVLITGASGGLGRYVCRVATSLGWDLLAPSHSELDLTDFSSIELYLKTHTSDVILHLAGLANVDRCQKEPQAAVQLNVLGTLYLAQLTKARIVFMSTNDVFSELPDAGIPGPYCSDQTPAPGNIYTWSKYAAEQAVLASRGTVVRANFFTRYCRAKESFVAYVLHNAQEHKPFDCYTNVVACPVFAETLAEILCSLAARSSSGEVLHIGTTNAVNRLEQAQAICHAYGLDGTLAQPKLLKNRDGRPLDARLTSSSCIETLYVNEEINKLRAAEPL